MYFIVTWSPQRLSNDPKTWPRMTLDWYFTWNSVHASMMSLENCTFCRRLRINNKDRPTPTVAQMFSRDSSFWRRKVYADICGASLDSGVENGNRTKVTTDDKWDKNVRNPANIRINLISPETRVHDKHYCCWKYGSAFIIFNAIAFKSTQKFYTYLCKKREFQVKWPFKVIKVTYFAVSENATRD